MTEQDVYAGLTAIFQDAFGDAALKLRPGMTAQDVEGWDSVRMIGLILAVEARFGIRVRGREAAKLTCIGDFAQLILAKLA